MFTFTVSAETPQELLEKLLDGVRALGHRVEQLDESQLPAPVPLPPIQDTPPESASQASAAAPVARSPTPSEPSTDAASGAVDEAKLRTELRTVLGPLMVAHKDRVTALISAWGSVSKVPVDQLANVVTQAKALAEELA